MSFTFKQTALKQAPSLVFAALLTGCSFTPAYKVPAVPTDAGYLEAPVATTGEASTWKAATPEAVAQAHWEVFNLPELPGLMAKLEKANPTLDESKATYEAATTLIAQARAGLLPTVGGTAATSRAKGQGGLNPAIATSRSVGLSSSWTLDIWGQQRDTVKADEASAKASANDLAAQRLALQGQLVQALVSLRVLAAERQLLDASAADYDAYLKLVKEQVRFGVAGATDVDSAETQLRTVQAQAVDLDVTRKQLEHAVAVLVGETPATFTMPAIAAIPGNLRAPVLLPDATAAGAGAAIHAAIGASLPTLPVVPVSSPSELLQRRPDIAAAERRVAAANYKVGVAKAAFFPSLSLTGAAGQSSNGLVSLLSAPAQYWSIGPSLAMPLFEGGLLTAQKNEAVAQWKEASASYRQTVLSAIQEVEDQLGTLNTLADEYKVEEQAVQAARSNAELTLAQYRAGTATGLSVIVANGALLAAENTQISLHARQLSAAVTLVEDMGGGYLPS
jgi:outer membrane protein TolC